MRRGPGLLPPGSDPGPAQPRARRGSAAFTPPPAAPHPQATSHGSGSVPRRGPALAPSPAVRPLTLHHKLRGRAELAGFARELGLVVRRTGDQYQFSGEGAPGLLQISQLHSPWLLGRPRLGHCARVLRAETDWGTAGSPAIPRETPHWVGCQPR